MDNKLVLEIDESGSKIYRLNGKVHREDGPAVEFADGPKQWFINGKLHRTDGPAIEFSNGFYYWYLHNKLYSFEEWLKLTPLSNQEKVKLRLQYAL